MRKHYEDYFALRTKEEVGAELQSFCSEPTSVRFFNEVIEAKAPPIVSNGHFETHDQARKSS
jgi:hypothetical protein